jgi:alkanesulfonate monooxygenase SsuD/methylene tetrahydromethanopterin reductase-like flavin-dependent oxidoreductase (luciferase family)
MPTEAQPKQLNEGLDYGHPLEFGYFLTPDADDPVGLLETTRLVDGLGYDLIGVHVQGAFTSTTQGPASDTDQAVVGPPEHWVEVLTRFATELGFGTFVLAAEPVREALTTFIEDVAPQVRERVAERRAFTPVLAAAPEHSG